MEIFFAFRSKSGRWSCNLIQLNQISHVDLNIILEDLELQSNSCKWNFSCRSKSGRGLDLQSNLGKWNFACRSMSGRGLRVVI